MRCGCVPLAPTAIAAAAAAAFPPGILRPPSLCFPRCPSWFKERPTSDQNMECARYQESTRTDVREPTAAPLGNVPLVGRAIAPRRAVGGGFEGLSGCPLSLCTLRLVILFLSYVLTPDQWGSFFVRGGTSHTLRICQQTSLSASSSQARRHTNVVTGLINRPFTRTTQS